MRAFAYALAIVVLLAAPASAAGAAISLDISGAPLVKVLAMFGAVGHRNIIADASVPDRRISVHLRNLSFDQAFHAVLQANALAERQLGTVTIVGTEEEMARRFPDSAESQERTVALSMHRADAARLVASVRPVLDPHLTIIPDERGGRVIVGGSASSVARAVALIELLDAPVRRPGARRIALRYIRATDAKATLAIALARAVVAVDRMHNALIVSGNATLLERVRRLVAQLDRPSPQVLFEVRVIDLTPVNDQSNFGLEFGGLDLGGQPIPAAATYAFSGGSIPLNVKLNALLSEGRARILATPKILTLSDRVAELHIGATYPIATSGSVFGSQSVQYIDIGVKLKIRATIGRSGSVIADIHPQYSEILGFTAQNFPIIANRRLDSTLRVRNGETIVLGGLLRDVSSETVQRIPFLSQIPILGSFFANKATSHERDEIVFLITPHVIVPGATPPSK